MTDIGINHDEDSDEDIFAILGMDPLDPDGEQVDDEDGAGSDDDELPF